MKALLVIRVLVATLLLAVLSVPASAWNREGRFVDDFRGGLEKWIVTGPGVETRGGRLVFTEAAPRDLRAVARCLVAPSYRISFEFVYAGGEVPFVLYAQHDGPRSTLALEVHPKAGTLTLKANQEILATARAPLTRDRTHRLSFARGGRDLIIRLNERLVLRATYEEPPKHWFYPDPGRNGGIALGLLEAPSSGAELRIGSFRVTGRPFTGEALDGRTVEIPLPSGQRVTLTAWFPPDLTDAFEAFLPGLERVLPDLEEALSMLWPGGPAVELFFCKDDPAYVVKNGIYVRTSDLTGKNEYLLGHELHHFWGQIHLRPLHLPEAWLAEGLACYTPSVLAFARQDRRLTYGDLGQLWTLHFDDRTPGSEGPMLEPRPRGGTTQGALLSDAIHGRYYGKSTALLHLLALETSPEAIHGLMAAARERGEVLSSKNLFARLHEISGKELSIYRSGWLEAGPYRKVRPSDLWRDTDGDDLRDGEELALGTHSRKTDSDGDGLADGWEYRRGLDPLRPQAPSARPAVAVDGLSDAREWAGRPHREWVQAGPCPKALLPAGTTAYYDVKALRVRGLPEGIYGAARFHSKARRDPKRKPIVKVWAPTYQDFDHYGLVLEDGVGAWKSTISAEGAWTLSGAPPREIEVSLDRELEFLIPWSTVGSPPYALVQLLPPEATRDGKDSWNRHSAWLLATRPGGERDGSSLVPRADAIFDHLGATRAEDPIDDTTVPTARDVTAVAALVDGEDIRAAVRFARPRSYHLSETQFWRVLADDTVYNVQQQGHLQRGAWYRPGEQAPARAIERGGIRFAESSRDAAVVFPLDPWRQASSLSVSFLSVGRRLDNGDYVWDADASPWVKLR